MADLLIHSMREFRHLILPCLELAQARHVVEIGAEFGGMSTLLEDWLRAREGRLWCIDPSPRPEFLEWAVSAPAVEHVARPSLEALEHLPCADAWLIDGDHNWYTVYNELRLILASCARAGKPPLIFLHDVGWPAARRDLYYAPERIPDEFRHDATFDAGVTLGNADVQWGRGFRGEGSFAVACHQGGPRNGVLTAVEDIRREETHSGRPLAWCFVPAVFGLGVLFDPAAAWSAPVAELLSPWHENPLVATLEKNRLENYLRVIELQDQMAESSAVPG